MKTRDVPRPADDELDFFGITDRGKVRPDNQDQFLVSTIHPQVVIHGTSLANTDGLPLRGTRLATVLLIADGVGGAAAGSEAARVATEAVTRFVSSTLRCYHAAGASKDEEFLDALRSAALEAHAAVLSEAKQRPDGSKMATTLTLSIVVWPWLYVVQVGDSRAYLYDGELHQITRDQTIGQELVDQGILPADRLAKSPFKHVLSSAIGADAALPVVTRVDLRTRLGAIILMCSDGLTKHVNDSELASALENVQSSETLVHGLLDLALSRGGTDNITIIAARAQRKRV
ncbi:MAG: PP2C family serine/threonine-protein phosphatase [Gemmatimonadaceae bacterium]